MSGGGVLENGRVDEGSHVLPLQKGEQKQI